MAAALDNGIMAEPQYCEPQKLKRFSSSASGTGTHMSSTGNTFTREQRLLVEEMPGYSEPLQCITTPTKVSWDNTNNTNTKTNISHSKLNYTDSNDTLGNMLCTVVDSMSVNIDSVCTC